MKFGIFLNVLTIQFFLKIGLFCEHLYSRANNPVRTRQPAAGEPMNFN